MEDALALNQDFTLQDLVESVLILVVMEDALAHKGFGIRVTDDGLS